MEKATLSRIDTPDAIYLFINLTIRSIEAALCGWSIDKCYASKDITMPELWDHFKDNVFHRFTQHGSLFIGLGEATKESLLNGPI
jgi:hypothetical protein